MIIPHNDPRLSWHGHISLEQTEEYTRPWRIPFAQRGLFSPHLLAPAATQAGVRLSFVSNATRIAGKILPRKENLNLDLCIEGKWIASAPLAGVDEFVFDGLPEGKKRLTLWLPQAGDFALRHLELNREDCAPVEDPRPRWVTYGSSITHCGGASSPTRTWPALVAGARDLNLTCLGFSGQCHLDPMVALMMRDLPADYFSLCAGINIYGSRSLGPRTFPQALIGFVQILREKHPTTPVLLISPIYSFDRETTPNAVEWTLQDYRRAVQEVAEILQAHGDKHLYHINGLELFDESIGHLMPDKLHPDAQGYEAMAENFLRRAAPQLFGAL